MGEQSSGVWRWKWKRERALSNAELKIVHQSVELVASFQPVEDTSGRCSWVPNPAEGFTALYDDSVSHLFFSMQDCCNGLESWYNQAPHKTVAVCK